MPRTAEPSPPEPAVKGEGRPAQPDSLGLLLGLVGVLGFAGTLPASRLAVPHLDPWFLTVARAALAGALAVPILLLARRRMPARSQWPALVISSVALVYGFPLFSALAMVSVPAAHGGVVLGILPLGTAAMAALVANERPSGGFWLAALVGSAVLTAFAVRHAGPDGAVRGDFLLLGMVVSGAVGYTYAGKLSFGMPGWEVICWAVVIALPLAAPLTLLWWPADAARVPASAWVALGYVALVSQLTAFFFWNAGLARGGIARVGQLQLLQPFAVLLLASVINAEPIEGETLLFAAAVIATVTIGQHMRVRRS